MRSGSAERRTKGSKGPNHCDLLLGNRTATQKHTNTLKALLQLNHLVFLEEMTEKHNSRKTRLKTAFFVLRNKTDPLETRS